jgi:2-polyprenyl-3-methyl-5-hydroxy-6-metoxy-1,4-benzoquinol methylase
MAPFEIASDVLVRNTLPITIDRCYVCHSQDYRLAFGQKFPQIVTCAGCGLIYTRELLPWDVMAQKYVAGEFSPLLYYQQTIPADMETAKEELKVLGRHTGPGRLLDVGCCNGTFMRMATAQGWAPLGLDINPAAAQSCRALGLNAEAGQVEDMAIPADKYDACHMGDVIEHLSDPIRTLRHISRMLRPGGVIMVSTPNIDSWAARLWQVKPGEHCLYFTRDTLRRMLQEAGLVVKSVNTYDRYLYLPALRQSSTFKNRAGNLLLIRLLSRLSFGHNTIKLPLGEHLIAIAQTA